MTMFFNYEFVSISLILLLLSFMLSVLTFYTYYSLINLSIKIKGHNKYLLIAICSIIFIIFNIGIVYILPNLDFFHGDMWCKVIPDGIKDDKVPMDPVGWWPSGVPQSMTIIGSMLGAFAALTKLGVPARYRVLGSLGAGSISSTTITYCTAVEHSLGFNRLMFGLHTYSNTGTWPSLDNVASKVTDTDLNKFIEEAIKSGDPKTISSIVDQVKKILEAGNSNKFLPDSNDILDMSFKVIDAFMRNFASFFKMVPVQGHLDDLIGQQMFIYLIVLLMSVLLLIVFTVYVINVFLLFNKDNILKRFNNRFLVFYVKYQAILIKVSLFYLPFFVFMGLFTIAHASYFLLTHQIPFEQLGIDLHIFISK